MDDQTERKVQRSSAKAEVTTTFTIPKTTCTFTACRYPQQKIHSELDKLPVLTMTLNQLRQKNWRDSKPAIVKLQRNVTSGREQVIFQTNCEARSAMTDTPQKIRRDRRYMCIGLTSTNIVILPKSAHGVCLVRGQTAKTLKN